MQTSTEAPGSAHSSEPGAAAGKQGQQPKVLTTDEIQRLLDENYVFIKAILEQQNLGRLQEMVQYQQKLQQNLMLLAAVADNQPQPQTVSHPGGSQAGTGAAQHGPAVPAGPQQRQPMNTSQGVLAGSTTSSGGVMPQQPASVPSQGNAGWLA